MFQAEDGIRDLVRSRGLGDVYKRQDSGSGRSKSGEIATFAMSSFHFDQNLAGVPVVA